MSIGYSQARSDHEYLWKTYGPAQDMTGGYVDSDDLDRLLICPTKTTARNCYCDQIRYWFQVGPDTNFGNSSDDWNADLRVRRIAERHDCDIPGMAA